MTNEILACVDGKWIIKINKDGIFFNRDEYPLAEPIDFAEAFLKILEKEFVVTFEKREKIQVKDNHSRTTNP